jgi:hypothetical protein
MKLIKVLLLTMATIWGVVLGLIFSIFVFQPLIGFILTLFKVNITTENSVYILVIIINVITVVSSVYGIYICVRWCQRKIIPRLNKQAE